MEIKYKEPANTARAPARTKIASALILNCAAFLLLATAFKILVTPSIILAKLFAGATTDSITLTIRFANDKVVSNVPVSKISLKSKSPRTSITTFLIAKQSSSIDPNPIFNPSTKPLIQFSPIHLNNLDGE